MQSYLKLPCSIVLVGLLGTACKKEVIMNSDQSASTVLTLSSGRSGNSLKPPRGKSSTPPPRVRTSNEVPGKDHIIHVPQTPAKDNSSKGTSGSQTSGSRSNTPPPQVRYSVLLKGNNGTSGSQTPESKPTTILKRLPLDASNTSQTSSKVTGSQHSVNPKNTRLRKLGTSSDSDIDDIHSD